MKETEFYLSFFKRNWLYLVVPIAIAVFVGIYFYSNEITLTKISQSFRVEYDVDPGLTGVENINTSLALADQAVSELRLQNFDNLFEGSKVLIYKPAPLIVSIDALSPDKNEAFKLLLKETEYLKKNFRVSTLAQIQIGLVEPNLFKYLLSALILGGLAGLGVSLIREYLKNY